MRKIRSFGFSSLACALALAFGAPSRAQSDVAVYTDSLAANWQNWSWASVDLTNTTVVHSGTSSIAVTAAPWTALYLSYVGSPAIDTTNYGKLAFWANGGSAGGQMVRVSGLLSGSAQTPVTVGPLAANTWTKYEINLADLGVANATTFNGIWLQEGAGADAPVFYVDDMSLVTTSGGPVEPPPVVDGLSLYDDAFTNGWQNWSWASIGSTSSVVSSGSAALSVTAGPYQALYFHHAAMPTQGYSNLVFYINGGPTGGQNLKVTALLSDAQQTGYALPALTANTWTQITIPLSSLGVANKPDLTGLWIQDDSGSNAPVFYVDNVYLQNAPPPAVVNLTVDGASSIRTVDPRIFALNTAIWDGVFNTATTAELLNDIDIQALRYPGGSISDVYHWQINQSEGQTFKWATDFDSFANIATTLQARVYITVNYGTGTPQEAADWVRYSNVTKNYGFKYWEVGNENYGTWEADNNTRPHDPATYAARFKDYYQQMKAVDPTIKIGAVVQASEDSDANYTDQTVINPRTGVSHNGWTAVLLSNLAQLGVTPDFVSYHRYEQAPGGENDAYLLSSSATWADNAATLRQILYDYLGAAASGVEIACTENNSVYSNPGKQSTSLVNGLFLADSIGNILKTEFKTLFWWDLRNGQDGSQNNSASLYGWRNYGDYGIVNNANPAGPADRYPTYYVYKLLAHYARGGESVLAATSDYNGLTVYAVRAQDGVRLLVLNKNRTATLNGSVTLTGFSPATQAQLYRYGIPQDEAARTGTGSADIETGSLAIPGKSFTYSAPPYSATVIALAADPATNISINRGGYVVNRRTNRVVQSVTIKNSGAAPITGPVYLALDGLSTNTSLANSAGATSQTTPTGSPYVLVTASTLAPNASVTVSLQFTVPASGGITYTPRAIVTGGTP
ncbi:alpha-L-arabinofuranosidase [Opitutaceae bacterium EW11]|nr:alpha-L-arabinofuranosidase [Opitutaceae bacterium EW11]